MIPDEAVSGWGWYWVGAGLWVICFGVAFAFAAAKDRRWVARYFFGFPVWPFVLGSITVKVIVHVWSAAEWRVRP